MGAKNCCEMEMRVGLGKAGKETFKVDAFYATIDYTKPLKFLMDEQRGIFPVTGINDDVMTSEESSSYYEEPLRNCGCVACCKNERCCGAGYSGSCYKGCKCHCNDDPDNDSDYESEEDESDRIGDNGGDIDQELREKYEKQCRSGECFDIDYVDYYIERYGQLNCNGLPARLMPSLSQYPIEFQDHIKKPPVLAIKRYNVMHPGMNYKCLELLDVNDRFDKYFITFIAANYARTGDYILQQPQTFQAKVGFYIEGTGRTIVRKVHFCRLKS